MDGPHLECAVLNKRKRYALYYTPKPGSALAAFGNDVFGDVRRPDWTETERRALAEITAEPRVYGFHATLIAPMRLAPGATEYDLLQACMALAVHRQPIFVGDLILTRIQDVIALVPKAPPDALGLFAAECVATLDPLRAPLSPSERARRRPERLDPRRRALLERWGYPHVFEAFRFHMTLTGSLASQRHDAWLAWLTQACPKIELVIDAVTLLCQVDDEPFHVVRRITFER